MDINHYLERAALLRRQGYNCCQAVAAALADQTDLSEEQLYQLASGFGLGMGNMEATCGALVGAGLVAGLVTSGKGTVRLTRQISEHFKTTCGAVICKELKGIGTGKVLCPCDRCVRNAVLAYAEVCGLSS